MDTNPGPGYYDANKFNKTQGPSFSLKGATSEDPIMREKKSTPAPGMYNPKDELVRKHGGGIAFGPRPPKPPKSELKVDGPGPGSYKLPTTLNQSKGGVLMTSSHSEPKLKVVSDSPGPGAYMSSTSGFLNSKRGILIIGKPKGTDKANQEHSPGPGAYEVRQGHTRTRSNSNYFGHGDRFKLAAQPDNKDMPGPGSYTYSNELYKPKGRVKKC